LKVVSSSSLITSNGSPYATGPLYRLSVCNAGVLWPNGWMDQHATWYGDKGLGPGDIVLDEDPAPPPNGKGHSNPHFSALVANRSPISATAELYKSS